MWVDNLPDKLEILSLLSVSSPNVSNAAAAPPLMLDPVVVPSHVPMSERAAYRREFNAARRQRAINGATSSTRGARKQSIGREDVLIALEGVSDLANFFVLGFTGLLTSASIIEYSRLVYTAGINENNSFTSVTMQDYAPVFAVAFNDLLNPCSKSGKTRTNIGTRNGLARSLDCSTAKAARLLECYNDTAHILLKSAQEVAHSLHVGLRRAA